MQSNNDSQDEAKSGTADLPGQNDRPVPPDLPVRGAEEKTFKVSLVSLISSVNSPHPAYHTGLFVWVVFYLVDR